MAVMHSARCTFSVLLCICGVLLSSADLLASAQSRAAIRDESLRHLLAPPVSVNISGSTGTSALDEARITLAEKRVAADQTIQAAVESNLSLDETRRAQEELADKVAEAEDAMTAAARDVEKMKARVEATVGESAEETNSLSSAAIDEERGALRALMKAYDGAVRAFGAAAEAAEKHLSRVEEWEGRVAELEVAHVKAAWEMAQADARLKHVTLAGLERAAREKAAAKRVVEAA